MPACEWHMNDSWPLGPHWLCQLPHKVTKWNSKKLPTWWTPPEDSEDSCVLVSVQCPLHTHKCCFQCTMSHLLRSLPSPPQQTSSPISADCISHHQQCTFIDHRDKGQRVRSTHLLRRGRQGPLAGDAVSQLSRVPGATVAADHSLLENRERDLCVSTVLL